MGRNERGFTLTELLVISALSPGRRCDVRSVTGLAPDRQIWCLEHQADYRIDRVGDCPW